MKQKIVLIISMLILSLAILIPNSSFAISSSGGYTIENYNIKLKVNENNTFDITEIIDVNFTGYNKHGIFRKIPLRNTISRLDGTKSNNRAEISNISVSDTYTESNEGGYKVLKIGNANQNVSGRKSYIIKYTYNIGKDPLKDADELYFNLIGNEWDTSIENVNFIIAMPKEFDKSTLGFSSGYLNSIDSTDIDYTVQGKTIKGSLHSPLYKNQGLTVRLTLPEGYFVGASNNVDYIMILGFIVPIIFVVIAYIIWKKYGKDDMVVDTVEFYPPNGLNSADIGFLYKGYSEQEDVISLLIYLANKGYLRIEEYEETTLKIIKTKSFKIIKVKEYDGNNEDERTFFEDLFKFKNEVTKMDLYDRFYKTLDKITKNINRKENQETIYEKASLGKRMIFIVMILIMFLLMGGLDLFGLGSSSIMIYGTIIIGIALVSLYTNPKRITIILTSFFLIIMAFIGASRDIVTDGIYLVKFIFESICLVTVIIFCGLIKKRTQYGNEMLGRIRGFKNFLETVEKPRLEEMVMQDPEYFYNILPYTYVLGVSNKWMEKFEDIALSAPTWYYGYSAFSINSFNRFLDSTYLSITNAMSSSPSSSGSGGYGGGFSGGGSGGGGRRFLVILRL